MYLHSFSNHFSSQFVHLDAFRVDLGALHIHLSLLGDGDAIWWVWNLWRWFRDKNGDFGSQDKVPTVPAANCSGQAKQLGKCTRPCPICTCCSGQMTCQKPAATLRKICTSVFTNFLPKLSWVNPGLLGRPSSFLDHYKYFLDLILGVILFSI